MFSGGRPVRRQYQFNSNQTRRPQQNANGNGDQRVIRSEVWNCFDLEGLNAICRACSERLKVGPTRQTSSLWRHLKRHSREVQNRLLQPRTVEHLANSGNNQRKSSSTGAIVQRKEYQYSQRQREQAAAAAAGLFNTAEHFLDNEQPSPNASSYSNADGNGPKGTVDPLENIDLEQLLGGIRANGSALLEPMDEDGVNDQMEEPIAGEDEGEEDVILAHQQVGTKLFGFGSMTDFETVLVEFLLENALPFHRLLQQSPSLGRLLRLFSSMSSAPQHPIPSPDSLLNQLAPEMFAKALDERKAQFEEDFFVLVLRRCRVEYRGQTTMANKAGCWILRVSAIKLSEHFGLCSRCLGVFAFHGGLNPMRDALQRCFETGRVQLKLWQVSAVVHDGSVDFAEMCRQLDLPGIPSARALLRNVYNELDKLDFGPNYVRRVKTRFERAIGDAMDGSNFSAFAIAVPTLVARADAFFQHQNGVNNSKEEANIEGKSKKVNGEEQRLLDKFRTLWQFQRERLLAEPAARWPIFLNPNACQRQQGPFSAEQWAQVEASIVEEICQACLPTGNGELSDNEVFERRADIEAEVNNYVDAAICEGRRATPSSTGHCDGKTVDYVRNSLTSPAPPTQQSLSELLYWWRMNLERFPRVGHLARQFCALPLCAEMGDDSGWKNNGGDQRQLDIDARNADYAAELLQRDLLTNGQEEEEEGTWTGALERLTQLLTVRMAVLEKNGCALPANQNSL